MLCRANHEPEHTMRSRGEQSMRPGSNCFAEMSALAGEVSNKWPAD